MSRMGAGGYVAITRAVSPEFSRCELTHVARTPIDLAVARREHAAYEAALERLGCTLRRLPAEETLPDSVFVEDTAIVLDDVAIIARPGAESRRPEIATIAAVLAEYRSLLHITAPGTLDGGDVLVVDQDVFIGRSSRTNDVAIAQVREWLTPRGYRVVSVDVVGCLHLKTAVGRVGTRTLLHNPAMVDGTLFGEHGLIAVDPAEPLAACALWVGDTVIFPAEFPKTLARLQAAGIRVTTLPLGELAKAEGGVTCCSLLIGPSRVVGHSADTSEER